MITKTPCELFIERFESDPETFKQDLSDDGSFYYGKQVEALIEFSNKVNENIFIKLYGEDLGKHLMSKFVLTCNRNLLQFFSMLSNEYRFFLLHQIKTNEQLYYPS